jgi:hypothetical protein
MRQSDYEYVLGRLKRGSSTQVELIWRPCDNVFLRGKIDGRRVDEANSPDFDMLRELGPNFNRLAARYERFSELANRWEEDHNKTGEHGPNATLKCVKFIRSERFRLPPSNYERHVSQLRDKLRRSGLTEENLNLLGYYKEEF